MQCRDLLEVNVAFWGAEFVARKDRLGSRLASRSADLAACNLPFSSKMPGQPTFAGKVRGHEMKMATASFSWRNSRKFTGDRALDWKVAPKSARPLPFGSSGRS